MTTPSDAQPRLARLAWWTLGVNLLVIIWGAFVRASGSGAGCGNHWPLCNGQVIPQSPTLHTIVELTHRVTSGVALLFVVALVVGTRRGFAPGHRARAAAVAAMVLMLVEAGIGAGLVKFELVAHNASMARAWSLAAHLVNTQLLLGAIALTGWWSAGHPAIRLRGRAWWVVAGLLGLMVVGTTGAIVSLGDTLFPATSLQAGLAQDQDPAAHPLIRLRVWHPLLAITIGSGLLVLSLVAPKWRHDAMTARASRTLTGVVLTQWGLGVATLALLVPVPLQLLHLLTADLLWLTVLWVGAALGADQAATTPARS
ncbi:MAG: COX15/CtaA family protein [Gemmatimonadales bacterium]